MVKKLKSDLERIGDDVFYFVKNLDETSTEVTSKFHMNVLEELENISDSISSLSNLTHKHTNNNHRSLTFNQIRELKELEDELDEFLTRIVNTFKTKNYTEISVQSIFVLPILKGLTARTVTCLEFYFRCV